MAYLRKPYHRISLWVRESESLKAEKVCKWEGVFQEQDPDYTKFPEKLWKILVCYFENRTCLWSPNTPIQTFKHTFQCAPSLMQDSKWAIHHTQSHPKYHLSHFTYLRNVGSTELANTVYFRAKMFKNRFFLNKINIVKPKKVIYSMFVKSNYVSNRQMLCISGFVTFLSISAERFYSSYSPVFIHDLRSILFSLCYCVLGKDVSET